MPGHAQVIEPVVARLGTMLEFLFANPYFIPTYDCGPPRYCPRITVIGPITAGRVRLAIQGRVEALVVLLRPLALYRFFETPVSYLAEGGTEGHSVAGIAVSALYERLGNTPEFSERKKLLDAFFLGRLDLTPSLDSRADVLRLLTTCTTSTSVSEAATQAGISTRQLERLSLQYAGATPKSLVRVARFERAS